MKKEEGTLQGELPLPELLLWKLRAHHYEAEMALEKARGALQRRDSFISEVRTKIMSELPDGCVLLEIDTEAGVFRTGVAPSCESASIVSPMMSKEVGNGSS